MSTMHTPDDKTGGEGDGVNSPSGSAPALPPPPPPFWQRRKWSTLVMWGAAVLIAATISTLCRFDPRLAHESDGKTKVSGTNNRLLVPDTFVSPMSSQAGTRRSSGFPRSFQVVAKPVGARCNLDCRYCYYLHKEDLLPQRTPGRMADGLLEEFIRQYVAGQEIDEVVFNWHGGEPALVSLDFYRQVVELQRKYAGALRVRNDFQTNGVLLDEAWCEFSRQNHFYVGLSIDGPKELHDRFRVAKGGVPTFDQVYRAGSLLVRTAEANGRVDSLVPSSCRYRQTNCWQTN